MEVIKIDEDYRKQREFLYYFGWDDHLFGADHDSLSWKRVMNEAADRNAKIFKVGDIIGAITHKDPRFTHNTLDQNFKKDEFIKEFGDELEKKFIPYADHIYGLGIGNHEWQFIKHYGFNPIRNLVTRLNHTRNKKLPQIQYMDITGWIWFTFYFSSVNKKSSARFNSSNRHGYRIFYHHGTSGNAPVTEGIIAAKRLIEGCDNVDCLVVGHVHKNWSFRTVRHSLSRSGVPQTKEVRIICGGSHQKSYKTPGDPNLSWAEKQGFKPSPMGGAFLKLVVDPKKIESRVEH